MKKILKDSVFLLLYYFSTAIRRRKKVPPEQINKILIISWHLIGDTFLSFVVIASLRKYFTKSEITVVCKPVVKDLVKNMGAVSDIVILKDDFLRDSPALRRLRNKYDLTIDLTNNLPSAFFSLISDGKYKIGGCGNYTVLGRKFTGFPNIYDSIISSPGNDYVLTYLYKIISKAFPEFEIDRDWRYSIPGTQNSGPEKLPGQTYIGFGLGASRNEKKWDKQNWINLAKGLTRDNDVTVFLLGGPVENALAEEIQKQAGEKVISLVNVNTLTQDVNTVKNLDYFVSNDTGIMHVAIHYNIPTICLMGPANALNYVPLDDLKIMTVQKRIFCQPCFYYLDSINNTLHHDCKYNIALCERLITVEDVLSAFTVLKTVVNSSSQ